jgi:hypothetical protein
MRRGKGKGRSNADQELSTDYTDASLSDEAGE